MSLIDPQIQLLNALDDAKLMARQMATMMKKFEEAGNARKMAPNFFRDIAAAPPFHAVLNLEKSTAITDGTALARATTSAVAAVNAITGSTTPVELRTNLEAFLVTEESIREDVESSGSVSSPEDVVRELKADFILTLSVTLTGHTRFLELVQEWETDSKARARAGKTWPASMIIRCSVRLRSRQ